jgi:phospholipase/carboxylesterase
MKLTTTEMGGLTTRIVDDLPDGAKPELGIIVCHGFGAPGTDLVPISQELMHLSGKLSGRARFYFPEGPLGLDSYGMFGSRAWWMIDMDALNRAMMEGTFRERARNDRPEGLEDVRASLLKLISEVRDDTGLPTSRLVLGGFSQGSMLTVDVATQLDEAPAGLLAWSGTLLNEDEWREKGARHKGLRVVQSHGRQDPLLSYAWAEDLREMMTGIGWDVDWVPFDGPHTVGLEGLQRSVALLDSLLDD